MKDEEIKQLNQQLLINKKEKKTTNLLEAKIYNEQLVKEIQRLTFVIKFNQKKEKIDYLIKNEKENTN
jgi:hypothetical protein